MLGSGELHGDGFGQLPGRDGRVRACKRLDVPGGDDDGDVYGNGRGRKHRDVFVRRDGAGHRGAGGDVPGEHDGAEDTGAVLDGGQLHGADADGQLSRSDGELHAGFRVDVPGGRDDGDVHGDGRIAQHWGNVV